MKPAERLLYRFQSCHHGRSFSREEIKVGSSFHPNTLAKWRKQYRQSKERAFAGKGRAYTEEARVAELERMVGRLTMECDLLKKTLHKLGS